MRLSDLEDRSEQGGTARQNFHDLEAHKVGLRNEKAGKFGPLSQRRSRIIPPPTGPSGSTSLGTL